MENLPTADNTLSLGHARALASATAVASLRGWASGEIVKRIGSESRATLVGGEPPLHPRTHWAISSKLASISARK
jgi:hypothetical protein